MSKIFVIFPSSALHLFVRDIIFTKDEQFAIDKVNLYNKRYKEMRDLAKKVDPWVEKWNKKNPQPKYPNQYDFSRIANASDRELSYRAAMTKYYTDVNEHQKRRMLSLGYNFAEGFAKIQEKYGEKIPDHWVPSQQFRHHEQWAYETVELIER